MEYKPSFVDQLDADYISHHGIKGQKWGVRRYQNADGSLTPAGQKRYSLNPIKRIQEKHQETKAAIADKKKFNEIQTLTAKARTAANAVEYRYADKKKESAIWDAMDDYEINPSNKNRDIVKNRAYEYGYDYGKKTGKHLVEKYGNEAVNRYVDVQTGSGTASKAIPDQRMTDILKSLQSRNAEERYAKYCAEKEATGAIETLYEHV